MVNGNIAAKNIRAKRQAHLRGQIGGRQSKFKAALGKARMAKAGPSLRDQAAAHRATKGTRHARLVDIGGKAGKRTTYLLNRASASYGKTADKRRQKQEFLKGAAINSERYNRAFAAARRAAGLST